MLNTYVPADQPQTHLNAFPEQNEEAFFLPRDWKITSHPQLCDEEKIWLANLEALVLLKMGHFNLSATMVADLMATSRATFFRQIKRLTGLTPHQYILEARFSTARGWLETRRYTSVKAVAISAGFRDVEHFSKQFRKRFGKRPSDYLV